MKTAAPSPGFCAADAKTTGAFSGVTALHEEAAMCTKARPPGTRKSTPKRAERRRH
jgi:hypothetical protein